MRGAETGGTVTSSLEAPAAAISTSSLEATKGVRPTRPGATKDGARRADGRVTNLPGAAAAPLDETVKTPFAAAILECSRACLAAQEERPMGEAEAIRQSQQAARRSKAA